MSVSTPEHIAAGTIVAERYRIDAPLGTGGMAVVYRARHLGLGRDVALKVMAANSLAGSAARFEREARAVARLDHPGCLRVLDFGHDHAVGRYLVMELIAGQTLGAMLAADGRMSSHRAVHILKDLTKALAHAHRHGVLHRDIKPENIMFDQRDGVSRPRLIDFGLAQLDNESALTAVGSCVGSPSYLAPERLLGLPYDARADIYALGVVLYELLCGYPPFGGQSAVEIARKQIAKTPVPLSVMGIEVPPAVDAIVARALAKDPTRRFADCEQLLAALDAIDWRDQPAAAPRYGQTADATLHAVVHSARITAPLWVLGELRPSPVRRLWTWLRFGAWRWRAASD